MKPNLEHSDYESMSYKALKDEAARREITVDSEHRSKAGIIELLKRSDAARVDAEAAKRKEPPAPKTDEELGPVEKLLRERVPQPNIETLKVYGEEPANLNRVEEGLRVRNLPADYIHAWAALTGGEEDVSRYTSLGWILVTVDMVTSNPIDATKIFVPAYVEHQGGYVRHQDTLLVIAHRSIVDARKESRSRNWNSRVESMYGERGKLSENEEVGDPTETSSTTFRRTAQITPEEMLSQGGDR